MMLGVNESLNTQYKNLAAKSWQLQRENSNLPVCTITTKNKSASLAPYLDNRFEETKQENVPVLVSTIKYRNQFGKVIFDNNVYFIFLGDVANPANSVHFDKDAKIIYDDNVYTVYKISYDSKSDQTQVEGTLGGSEIGGKPFLGVT